MHSKLASSYMLVTILQLTPKLLYGDQENNISIFRFQQTCIALSWHQCSFSNRPVFRSKQIIDLYFTFEFDLRFFLFFISKKSNKKDSISHFEVAFIKGSEGFQFYKVDRIMKQSTYYKYFMFELEKSCKIIR